MNLTKMLVSHTLSRFVSFYQGCPRTLRTALVLLHQWNAERFTRNDWNRERTAERFAWNDLNGELLERFERSGLDFKICILIR